MKNPFSFFLFSTIVLLLISCQKEKPQDFTTLQGENYYPLEVGKYIVYEVDTITWFEQSGTSCIFISDTSHSYLKEEIVGTYIDNSGTENFILERFTRYQESDPWEIQDVWNIAKYQSKLERVEENFRFIKMTFPVVEGASWDGNAFIDTDTSLSFAGNLLSLYRFWDPKYKYTGVDESQQIGDIALDSVATIVQSDTDVSNSIQYRYSVEKYARNIGLVFKEMRIIDSQCCGLSEPEDLESCHAIPWEERAEKGFKLVQTIVDYN